MKISEFVIRHSSKTIQSDRPVLWRKLFQNRLDDAPVFSGQQRHHLFKDVDLFSTQGMLMRKIPLCNLIATTISSANRFDGVREHELVQVVMHGSDTDMKLRSKV